jgi:hypothetical protein
MLGNPFAATKVDPIANGKANTVCEKRMNFRVRWRTPNIDDMPGHAIEKRIQRQLISFGFQFLLRIAIVPSSVMVRLYTT